MWHRWTGTEQAQPGLQNGPLFMHSGRAESRIHTTTTPETLSHNRPVWALIREHTYQGTESSLCSEAFARCLVASWSPWHLVSVIKDGVHTTRGSLTHLEWYCVENPPRSAHSCSRLGACVKLRVLCACVCARAHLLAHMRAHMRGSKWWSLAGCVQGSKSSPQCTSHLIQRSRKDGRTCCVIGPRWSCRDNPSPILPPRLLLLPSPSSSTEKPTDELCSDRWDGSWIFMPWDFAAPSAGPSPFPMQYCVCPSRQCPRSRPSG